MPENLQAALDKLDEHDFSNNLSRSQNYLTVQNALNKEEAISLADVKRLLDICAYDLKENIKHTTTVLKVILTILSKIKMGKYCPHPDLLPSALAVIHIIKTTALLSKVESLKELCFETLLTYPDETLIAVTECQEEVFEILNLYCHLRIPTNTRLQTCTMLHRLLKILPPEKKKKFVERGLNVWFSKIIPAIMNNLLNETTVEVLELLTNDIVALEYTDSAQWHSVMECICTNTKYPALLKMLLEKGCGLWCRLWIVFIKLLKHQVTQAQGSIGTPINSMLPVVENAFKMDVDNRCRAFDCWNVLIDSFSTETNESNINKRIKLLIIPLKSNNAKAEKTALAKFKCWWHLLIKFQTKMDKFLDTILVSFLQFSFGRFNTFEKNTLVPGQISKAVTSKCIQAIVEIVGHVNCDGCTDLPKLKDKLITTKHLVDNWNHWIYSLTRTVMLSVTGEHGLTKQQMTCLWKSFLKTIGELPENNIRKDLFNEMLLILVNLVQECKFSNKQREMVFNVLLLSVFDKDPRIKELLKTRSEVNDPFLYKIVLIVLDQALKPVYQRYSTTEIISYLRPLTDTILDPAICSPFVLITWMLDKHLIDDISLMLWAALAESICELKTDVPFPSLCKILLWPLGTKSISFNTEKYMKITAIKWQNLYDMFHLKLVDKDISKETFKLLLTPLDVDSSTLYMKLSVALCILKYKLNEENYQKCEKEIVLLKKLTIKMNAYEDFEDLFPLLIDTVLEMINIIATSESEPLARHVIVCVKKIIAILTSSWEESEACRMTYLSSLLNPLDLLFKVDAYSLLIPFIFDEIIDMTTLLSKQSATKSTVISFLKTVSSKMDETSIKYHQIKNLIHEIIFNTNNADVKRADVSANEEVVKVTHVVDFQTPKSVEVLKKVNKKSPNIVNTVVENGEEYVVLKSTWKFNPRKLTENQKEKFQRKREDIPALYQDLSQSQDEFKLATWKTDSQDTSNSSRSENKSNKVDNNDNATEMLKKLPSSDVVPKILENFFSENDKKEATGNEKGLTTNTVNSSPLASPKTNNNVNVLAVTTPKNTKSPRMALKDRVFRNVRNLIEKSGNMENSDTPVDLNKTENVIKTPTQTKVINSANLVNSAPPLLSAHRPTRVKRKPKKYDELQVLSAKKSRKTSQDQKSDDNSQTESEETLKQMKTMEPVVLLSVTKDGIKSIESEANKVENIKVDEDIQSEENSQKDKEETNVIDKVNKVNTESVVVKDQDKNVTVLDSDIISIDSDENDEKCSEKNIRMANVKSEQSNDKKKQKSPVKEKVDANVKAIEKPILKNAEMFNDKNEQSNDKKKKKSPVKEKVYANVKATEKPILKNAEMFNDKNEQSNDKKKKKSPVKGKVDANVKAIEKPILKNAEMFNDKNEKNTDKKIQNSPVKEEVDGKIIAILKPFPIKTEMANDDECSDKKRQKSPVKNKVAANEEAIKKPIAAEDPKSIDNKDKSSEKVQSPIKNEVSTPQQFKSEGTEEQKSTAKKRVKKSRIETELAIDMVEGNPFLNLPSQKRLTRKALEAASGDRRKSLANKLNKSKDINNVDKRHKRKDKIKDSDSSNSSTTVDDSQDIDPNDQFSFSQEVPYSDDVIESSQDSSITTISVKSTKKTPKKIPLVALEKMNLTDKMADIKESQSILDCVVIGGSKQPVSNNHESRDDIELPLNKTVDDKTQGDNTENMDTEPFDDKTFTDIIIVDDDPSPLIISDETVVGLETQELAEADTQPTDPKEFMDSEKTMDETSKSITLDKTSSNVTEKKTESPNKNRSVGREVLSTNDLTITLTDPVCIDIDNETASSPASVRDEVQRKKDFLNNTLEISPIKNMSPDRNKKSPSPDTSNDYVVIKLTSPVHSNGEPYEKCSSPEVFTDDKGSPDKRDQSPPRVEVTVTSTSPSSSLSLKKNRPQVRSSGRAAQMLGLCVPEKVQAIVNPEKSETEEIKKTNSSTPARRNLRILYNTVSDNVEMTSENDESETFLKFRRSLPAVDSSPSCPILKRKLIEITDDGTVSPASKRKRVSFHDPPVSTTVSVQKYIEPGSLRSPQNSVHKRMERQLRQHTPLKSPKRLDHAFKLDTVLTKTIESFSESELIALPDDTQPSSLDETPVVEIVRASELNDTDPICPELLDCKDSIDNIAGELSSPAMKSLLVKELVGKIETIGDLAKMTELEVNRLCIKAPKVKVARKVLTDYVSKRVEKPIEITPIDANEFDEPMTETELNRSNMEVQKDVNVCVDVEMQTVPVVTSAMCAQTDSTPIAHTSAQTDESGSKSTSDIVKLCLAERNDFVQQVGEHLNESSIQQLSDKLPFSAVTDVLMRKVTPSDCKTVLNRILEHQCNNPNANKISNELSFIRDYMCGRFDSKDLILFCSEVLKSMYDKSE